LASFLRHRCNCSLPNFIAEEKPDLRLEVMVLELIKQAKNLKLVS
jgi:hypothetical protein